jgi:hypothetical protein
MHGKKAHYNPGRYYRTQKRSYALSKRQILILIYKKIPFLMSALSQGDQTGLVFADWAIVYFEQLFENYGSSPNIWTIFSAVKVVN